MISKYVINGNMSLIDALEALNGVSDSGLTLFVENKQHVIIGSITDGDIRRRIISGKNLRDNVMTAMKPDFAFLFEKDKDNIDKIKVFRNAGIRILPILNIDCRLVSICDLYSMKSLLPIDAVLMAGGKGERLRPLTENTPKPLLKVGDKAIIDYNVERLISFGIKHLFVTVNYLKEQIERHFSIPINDVQINCVREPEFLGTIGSVKFVNSFYNDIVLVMNSDLFTNLDYEDFYLHFKENDADMSVAAVPYPISVPYGIFELEGRNIVGVKEKPTYNYYANAGIYLIKRNLLDLIPDNAFFNATDFMEILIKQKMKVIRFPITGYWLDIGKHEEYDKAKELVKHVDIK